MSVNFMDLCRLCLVKEKVSIPIFEGEGDARQIFVKIAACLPVKVERNDKLPKKICDNCLYKVENVYQFWNTTANSEKQLLQWLGEATKHEATPSASTVLETEELMMKVEAEPEQVSKDVSKEKYPLTKRSEEEESVSEDEEEGGSVSEDSMTDGGDTHEGPNKEEVDSDEDAYGELEPTTFVNVSMACEDQAGPSGVQQPTEDSSQANKLDILSVGQSQAQPSSGSAATTAPSGSSDPLELADNTQYERWLSVIKRYMSNSRDAEYTPAEHKCEICGKKFMYGSKLNTHMIKHAKDRPFKCSTCDKNFKSRQTLRVHEKTHRGEQRFACDICGWRTDQKCVLNFHVKKHKEQRDYKCDKCGKTFYTPATLRCHERTHEDVMYRCDVCARQFRQKSSYDQHKKKHDPNYMPVLAFQCETCGKGFESNSALWSHIRKHTGANKATCDICGKRVTCLQDHRRVHTGERPFVCSACGKAFSTTKYLKIHTLSHTGEKPHACDRCGKRFTQRSTLVVHRRYHSGERPYACASCPRAFVTRTLLNTHVRQQHSFGQGVARDKSGR